MKKNILYNCLLVCFFCFYLTKKNLNPIFFYQNIDIKRDILFITSTWIPWQHS